jgi:hypothetical protein
MLSRLVCKRQLLLTLPLAFTSAGTGLRSVNHLQAGRPACLFVAPHHAVNNAGPRDARDSRRRHVIKAEAGGGSDQEGQVESVYKVTRYLGTSGPRLPLVTTTPRSSHLHPDSRLRRRMAEQQRRRPLRLHAFCTPS